MNYTHIRTVIFPKYRNVFQYKSTLSYKVIFEKIGQGDFIMLI